MRAAVIASSRRSARTRSATASSRRAAPVGTGQPASLGLEVGEPLPRPGFVAVDPRQLVLAVAALQLLRPLALRVVALDCRSDPLDPLAQLSQLPLGLRFAAGGDPQLLAPRDQLLGRQAGEAASAAPRRGRRVWARSRSAASAMCGEALAQVAGTRRDLLALGLDLRRRVEVGLLAGCARRRRRAPACPSRGRP